MTTHGGKLNLCHNERTKNGSVIFTDETFRKVNDEDLTFVHNLTDIKRTFRLSNDVTDHRVGGKGADLVENRSNCLGDELVVPAGELYLPEV